MTSTVQARTSITVALAGALALGVGGLLLIRAGAPAPEAPPSVLVVLWDTVRADRMSLYGYDRPTTPGLEALAAESVVYDQAMSPGMWTVPAHGSLFTGLPASSHGAKVGWLWLDEQNVTMAEHFGASGYETFAWSSNPYLSEQTNLLQGFATQRFSWRGDDAARTAEATHAKLLDEDRSVEISPGWVPSGPGDGWPEHLTTFKDGGTVIGDAFLGWLDGLQPDKPFFAYLNYLEAHHPRVPSIEARRAVSDEPTIARALRTDMGLFRIMSAMEDRASFDDDELAAMSATYDATLVDLDAATTALLDGLRARGRLDDTIVVLLSDHGEHLGEHGMFDHRWSVGQELVHVPLLIHWPAGLEPARVATPVSTGHLFGTLLELTGLPAPDVSHPLAPLGTGAVVTELVAPTPRLPEIRQAWPDLSPTRWKGRYQAWFGGDLKLVRALDGSESLFDLSTDPGELRSVLDERPDDAGRLRDALRAWDHVRPRYDKARRTRLDHPGNPLKVDQALADQLKLLGYTSDHDEEEDP